MRRARSSDFFIVWHEDPNKASIPGLLQLEASLAFSLACSKASSAGTAMEGWLAEECRDSRYLRFFKLLEGCFIIVFRTDAIA